MVNKMKEKKECRFAVVYNGTRYRLKCKESYKFLMREGTIPKFWETRFKIVAQIKLFLIRKQIEEFNSPWIEV